MKEMIKRCLSLGFSLSVVVLMKMRGINIPAQRSAELPKLPEAPPPPPRPVPGTMVEIPPTSAFSGTVVRDGSRFALRQADGALFGLDSAGRAWSLEGEAVKITGYVNPESKLLHISAIDEVDDLRAEAV
jgi:hypothetical protein